MAKYKFQIITLTEKNIETEHICCALGNDKTNRERAAVKKSWLKERFTEGYTFKKFNIRGKAFIEYVPAENAWCPVEAPGYMFIHCFWVAGKYKGIGLGTRLLEECMKNSSGKNGIVALSTEKVMPFLTDKKFFIKNGFEVCDTAHPYFELLVKRMKDCPLPRFREKAKRGMLKNQQGVTIMYTDQCPFSNAYVDGMADAARKSDLPVKIIKITNTSEAQDAPTAFPLYSVFFDGEFITHEIMTEKKFTKLLSNYIQ